MPEFEQRLKRAPWAGYGPCCGHCVILGAVAVPSRLLESMVYFQFGCTVDMQVENQNGRNLLQTIEFHKCLKKEPRGFSLYFPLNKKMQDFIPF